MTKTGCIFRRRQGADSASHVKLCNPFLPDGGPYYREPTATEGS
jgi:hypothetical protein